MSKRLGQSAVRIFLLLLGVLSLLLGIAGVFLPLLPTTPFVLLAAWCFMRSSERFHNWLLAHRILGPIVLNWREKGAIPPMAKAMAVGMILISLTSIWLFAKIFAVKVGVSILLSLVTVFVLTRPSA